MGKGDFQIRQGGFPNLQNKIRRLSNHLLQKSREHRYAAGFRSYGSLWHCRLGSDVYLVGDAWNNTGRSQAILWKNGTAIPLTDGSHFAMATGIFIQGSDVYI